MPTLQTERRKQDNYRYENAFIEKIVQDVSLKLAKTGSDKINFSILKMLSLRPMSLNKLCEMFSLSKMPMWRRLKMLIDVGLIKKNKYNYYRTTELTEKFFNIVEKMRCHLIKQYEVEINENKDKQDRISVFSDNILPLP